MKFAVFDIDGTVFRWQLYHELFDELHAMDVISDEDVAPVIVARAAWRDRTLEFGEYELILVRVMERSIIGMRETDLIEAAKRIIERQGGQTYRYTTELIKSLKSQGYRIIAISGSHQQIVELFAAKHGIDIAYGKRHDIEDGMLVRSSGNVYGNKAPILKQIVTDNSLSWKDSYAIGDTGSDADMLELVDYPVAFNPDAKLYKRARQENWRIVIERKDMIYEMESDGAAYILE